jgi:hypothetical protein
VRVGNEHHTRYETEQKRGSHDASSIAEYTARNRCQKSLDTYLRAQILSAHRRFTPVIRSRSSPLVGKSLAFVFISILLSPGWQSAPVRSVTAQRGQVVPVVEPPRPIDLIVDVETRPNKYWNKTVTLKGHVVSVRPDPPGTNRGSYTFRDSSDQDMEVQTTDLPAVGTEFFVFGTVLQLTIDTKVPVVHEDARSGTMEELQRKIKDLNKEK